MLDGSNNEWDFSCAQFVSIQSPNNSKLSKPGFELNVRIILPNPQFDNLFNREKGNSWLAFIAPFAASNDNKEL
jgi:hypothetical protein